MRVLVTGAFGMLGHDVVEVFSPGHEILACSKKDLDVTDEAAVRAAMQKHRPEAVIHCAAFTNVDGCETQREEAFCVNAEGAAHVASALPDSCLLIHISTDYVFDGSKSGLYDEGDPTNPVNVYGESKLAGEREVLRLHAASYVVRTSWLYGLHGKNFVYSIRDLTKEKDTLQVVDDQRGAPTWTRDLAKGLKALMEKMPKYGIYHITNGENCSWREFAMAIGKAYDRPRLRVDALTTEQFGRPARRPLNSCLNNEKMVKAGLNPLQPWAQALGDFVALDRNSP